MKHFHNLKISSKLVASYAVLIVLFAAGLSACLVGINMVSNDLEEFYEDEFQVTQITQAMKTDLQGFAKGLARVALGTENSAQRSESEAAAYLAEKTAEMQGFLDNLKADIDRLEPYVSTRKAELDVLQTTYPVIVEQTATLLDLYGSGRFQEGLLLSDGDLDENGYAMGTALNTIIETAQTNAETKYQSTQATVRGLIRFSVVLAICLVAAAVLLCLTLSRVITRPLKEMEQVAARLSEGDLAQDIRYESRDELGILADSMRETVRCLRLYIAELDRSMGAIGGGTLNDVSQVEFRGDFVSIRSSVEKIQRNLTDAMIQINTSADQVMRGAEQIAGSGQALSQATLEQASSVEELGATINDISDRVRESADAAAATSQLAENVGVSVTDSSRRMQEMSGVMDQMREMSGKMSGIIKSIEDIAFQTNILSLNAAVEAARAGEAGKGFSVVANEIRRLSAKTTEASKSTSELLGQTVSMMVRGADMATAVSEKLLAAAQDAKNAADRVERISESSNEQATAVVQLRESIEQISDIVQENSATAEESAASSEELSGQMQMLKNLVGSFTYDG